MADKKINLHIGTKVDTKALGKMNRAVELVRLSFLALGRMIVSPFKIAGSAIKSVFTNLMNIKAGLDILKSGFSTLKNIMSKAFSFETAEKQFTRLMGSSDAAKEHMQDLKEMGETPPFSLEEFQKASRTLMVLTGGVLGTSDSLKMIGDVAAGTGNDIETVSDVVGRFFAALEDGESVGRTVTQLKNMGAITPGVAADIKELEENGASMNEIWDTLTEAFSQYEGAMADSETTSQGLIDSIEGQWNSAVIDFTEVFQDLCKDGLSTVLEWMKQVREDGSIVEWAGKTKNVLLNVIDWFKEIGGTVESVYKKVTGFFAGMIEKYEKFRHWCREVGAILGGFVGGLAEGGSFSEAIDRAREAWTAESMDINEEKIEKAQAKAHKQAVKEARENETMFDVIQVKSAREEAKKKAEKEKELKRQSDKEKIRHRLEEAERARQEREDAKQRKKMEAFAKQAAKKAEEAEKKRQQKLLQDKKNQFDKEKKLLQDELKQEKKYIDESVKIRQKGVEAAKKYHNGLFGEYAFSTNEEGGIKYFRDFERALRYGDRVDRENKRRDISYDKALARYERLKAKEFYELSARDQKYIENFEHYENQKNPQSIMEKLTQEMNNKIADIDTKLENLGLK